MRIIIQRVLNACVSVDTETQNSINYGMLILLGIEDADTQEDINWLCKKISGLRIFNDENNVMNKSILDINGDILIVSQFTLHASTKNGNRPSYIRASKPSFAITMYNKFTETLERSIGKTVKTGKFGANMKVALINDGPVTIIIDSKNKDF